MNMQKTAVASAIALSLGTVCNTASAFKIIPHGMVYSYTDDYLATGALYDSTIGGGSYGTIHSVTGDPFFGHTWTANAVTYFGTHGTGLTWAGTSPNGDFSYNFTLTGYQVAWGAMFAWNSVTGIPVLAIMDCGANGATGQLAETCEGVTTLMATTPFKGSPIQFTGDIHEGTVPFSGGEVPIPAAAWLFGSGLVGLAGIGRRRKKG